MSDEVSILLKVKNLFLRSRCFYLSFQDQLLRCIFRVTGKHSYRFLLSAPSAPRIESNFNLTAFTGLECLLFYTGHRTATVGFGVANGQWGAAFVGHRKGGTKHLALSDRAEIVRFAGERDNRSFLEFFLGEGRKVLFYGSHHGKPLDTVFGLIGEKLDMIGREA